MSTQRWWTRRLAWGALLTILLSWPAAAQERDTAVVLGHDQSLECTIADGFTLAAVGDLIINQPASQLADPQFQAAIDILRHADAGFGNFEGTSIDIRRFQGFPGAENGGAWLIDDPAVPADLKRMGIEMVSRANNHATDWGLAGMEETDRRLSDAGVVYAGSGRDLSAARAARMLNTAQGRVAIVSMASSFTPDSRAMDALRAAPGRPGIDALRTTQSVVLPKPLFEDMRVLRDSIYAGLPAALRAELPKPKKKDVVSLLGSRYELGKQVGLSFEMNAADLKGIEAAIRQGKETADFLVATIHAHEPGNWSEQPPDFLPKLAHAAIDAGADEFIGHGPHQLRGIEIYKGKPIFYSLGNFFFEVPMQWPVGVDLFDAYQLNPDSATDEEQNVALLDKYFAGRVWYQSVIAVSRFEHGHVAEIRLYPVVLGATRRSPDRGIPRLAPPAEARQILERLQRLSAPYHTRIDIEGSVGVIRAATAAAGGA